MLTPAMPCYGHAVIVPQRVNPVMMSGGEEVHGVQQPHADPEYGGNFNFDEWLNIDVQEQMCWCSRMYICYQHLMHSL
jgi:hypothetical protein